MYRYQQKEFLFNGLVIAFGIWAVVVSFNQYLQARGELETVKTCDKYIMSGDPLLRNKCNGLQEKYNLKLICTSLCWVEEK